MWAGQLLALVAMATENIYLLIDRSKTPSILIPEGSCFRFCGGCCCITVVVMLNNTIISDLFSFIGLFYLNHLIKIFFLFFFAF